MTLHAAPADFLTARRVAAQLSFRRAGRRTVLGAQHTPHPFHITRPFAHDGDPDGMATLYLQSSSGGLYAGDDLSLDVTVGPDAAVHLTTQASTVAPGARGGTARQRTAITAAAGSLTEYVADPLILFDGAAVETTLDVTLAPGARAILIDGLMLHRPGAPGPVDAAWRSTLRLAWTGGAHGPLVDRQAAAGAALAAALTPPGGTAPFPMATVVLAGAPPDAPARLTDALDTAVAAAPLRAFAGVTHLAGKGVILARIAAPDGATLTRLTAAAWSAARLSFHPDLRPRPRRK